MQKDSDSPSFYETSIYLTHTGLVNDAGVEMPDTIGRYAYRFVCFNVSQDVHMVVLCSDSLEVEKLQEFVNYQLQ